MEWTIAGIIGVYFVIGAIAIRGINRRSEDRAANRERWIKYGMYALIVNVLVWSMGVPPIFQSIAGAILLVALLELIAAWSRNPNRSVIVLATGMLVFLAVSVLFSRYVLAADLREQRLVYVLIFTFDGFSQLAGQLFGKHAFAPEISPNKTTEGLAGGLITALATALLLQPFLHGSVAETLLIALIVCTAGLLGDLLASAYKRRNALKDYSRILPGHGGILDRFDSYLVAGAAFGILTFTH